MLKVKDLRKEFIKFFKEKKHRIIPSSSLVPKDDPTLLFTTAGMVQFKPFFAGSIQLDYTRAASIQKCLRTSDLELVGKTKRHLSFFEMLGNFSFGDYFKKEAIDFAWEFSTEVIKFPKEKIWISIYEDDDEAFDLWEKRIGLPKEKIVRLGKEDNFWGPAGDSGACGPCSELYLDRGEDYGCQSKSCQPGCDCERFLEFWNLVFNQYNQSPSGQLTPLPRTGIDTGMGLERLATLIQEVDSVYDTDEFRFLTRFIEKQAQVKYEKDKIVPLNIIAEHARTLVFAMSDGVYPANDGRGYVLRRILRRALRYTRDLGLIEPFLYKLVDPLVKQMSPFYPELKGQVNNLQLIIKNEEIRFLETIENGLDRLQEIIKKNQKKKSQIVSGRQVFTLYDTFGFPLEMTEEILAEKGLQVDLKEFQEEMKKQQERGKHSWKGEKIGSSQLLFDLVSKSGPTDFKGYQAEEVASEVIGLADESSLTEKLALNQKGVVILKATSFYGESGGQLGDQGEIITETGSVFKVDKTDIIEKTICHLGKVVKGELKLNDKVKTKIDIINRNLLKANHTVTHLLQAALRQILGDHVKQAGSLVEAERMRFDFSHFAPLAPEEIKKIEELVNQKIWENIKLQIEELDLEEAIKQGALAVFDEKYDQKVRVVSVNDFSKELCGGTHVSRTGEIGLFKIIKEFSPGAGLRRIEGLTTKGVFNRISKNDQLLLSLVQKMKIKEDDLELKIDSLLKKNSTLEKDLAKLKEKEALSDINEVLARAEEVKGFKIVDFQFKNVAVKELKKVVDLIKAKEKNYILIFGSLLEAKSFLLFVSSPSGIKKGIDCRDLIKESAEIIGGQGGGRPEMAQAGGNKPELLPKALKKARDKIIELL